jgi:hypothetical protein
MQYGIHRHAKAGGNVIVVAGEKGDRGDAGQDGKDGISPPDRTDEVFAFVKTNLESFKSHLERKIDEFLGTIRQPADGKDGRDAEDKSEIIYHALQLRLEEFIANVRLPKDGERGLKGEDGKDGRSGNQIIDKFEFSAGTNTLRRPIKLSIITEIIIECKSPDVASIMINGEKIEVDEITRHILKKPIKTDSLLLTAQNNANIYTVYILGISQT